MSRSESLNASKGFTIVETLFVLAIAGIFFLIIFEAIPSLTRSSRNSERKHDVSTILEAVSHYESANSGDLPPSPPSPNDIQNYLSNYYTLQIYDPSAVDLNYNSPSEVSHVYANPTSVVTNDKVEIEGYAFCSGSDYTNAGAGFNNLVAVYSLESGSGSTPQCQQL
jgi:prepilin-type N-terminal cleavage/methylation domain-containing protein